MSEVVGFRGQPVIAQGAPQPDIVRKLEDALDMARAGAIQGIQIVMLCDDGCVLHIQAGATQYNVVGMLFSAAHDCLKTLERD